MTHFIFGTRGIYAATQQMIADLTAQRFWWRRKNLTKGSPNYGKIEDTPVQGILRPIQLWEYVFPKESPIDPGNLNSPMEDNTPMILRSFDLKGPDHYIPTSIGKYVRFAGKMMGLKPIPEVDPKGPMRAIHQHGISTIPIGLKDDDYKVYDFGPAGTYEQEGI